MRMMPKINVSPTPKKDSNAACDSSLTLWLRRKASVLMGRRGGVLGLACNRPCPRDEQGRTGRLKPTSVVVGGLLAAGRGALTREGRDHLGDRRIEAVLLDHLDHEPLLHSLVIAVAELDLALDAVELDRLESGAQRRRVHAVRLLDAGLDHLHRLPCLAFEGVGQRAAVLLAPELDELLVLGVIVAEGVARGADQPQRSLADRLDAGA